MRFLTPSSLRLVAASSLLAVAACAPAPSGPGTPEPVPVGPDPNVLPAIQREFRGMWTATVANIDWPSRAGLAADQQRSELTSIMDRAVATGINALILHVRPAGDALYQSSNEPWGAMLTGTQGVDPGYDPLAFAVAEAHRRGLELHAWVNPFRAGTTADSGKLAATHLFRTRRDLVRVYGKNLWMDPGEEAVHDHSMRVILDIVQRYDVDAVHLDDYFYPYQEVVNGAALPFPDSAAYARYTAGGGTLGRDDWRRSNVDRFVERLYRDVHAAKPWVRVGISPFGIWRPGSAGGAPGTTGLDAYASIYADARKWLTSGWVDYLAPQLYWATNSTGQPYATLLDWWLAQNTQRRFVWPGIATYHVFDSYAWPTSEIATQVKLARDKAAGGAILYNTTNTLKPALTEVLVRDVYQTRALSPAATWLDATPPAAPTLTVTDGTTWRGAITQSGEPIRFYVVRSRAANAWTTRVISGSEREVTLPSADWVVVNAVDRVGNVSADAAWRKP